MTALLLIGNKSDDTLAFVDPETLQVCGLSPTGRGPHEVVVAPDGRRAYVANYEGPGDTLSVIEIATMSEQGRIPLDPYRGPHGMAFHPDRKTLYVTCERSQAVVAIDSSTETVVQAFETGQSYTHMLALTPKGDKLYTANIGSGNSTVIDLTAGTVLGQISTGEGCEGIAVRPDGKEVWTTNRAADTLSVIDLATDRVVETLPCPGFPIRVQFLPDGRRALVSCARANQVAVWDVATRSEIERIEIGAVPIGLLIEPGGRRAYVANTEADMVAVLDLESLRIVGQIEAGRTPDGMAWVTG